MPAAGQPGESQPRKWQPWPMVLHLVSSDWPVPMRLDVSSKVVPHRTACRQSVLSEVWLRLRLVQHCRQPGSVMHLQHSICRIFLIRHMSVQQLCNARQRLLPVGRWPPEPLTHGATAGTARSNRFDRHQGTCRTVLPPRPGEQAGCRTGIACRLSGQCQHAALPDNPSSEGPREPTLAGASNRSCSSSLRRAKTRLQNGACTPRHPSRPSSRLARCVAAAASRYGLHPCQGPRPRAPACLCQLGHAPPPPVVTLLLPEIAVAFPTI